MFERILAGLTYSILIWLAIFTSSAMLGGLISSKRSRGKDDKLIAGIYIQLLFTVLSLLAGLVFKLRVFTFTVDGGVLLYSMASLGVLLPLSLLLNYYYSRSNAGGYGEEIIGMNHKLLSVITLLLLAPLGEESLFRGILEGMLLMYGEPFIIAVLIPAVLFALIHYQPLHGKPMLLAQVLIIGLILSYIMYLAKSLIPVVIGHSALNLGGLIIYKAMGSGTGVASQGIESIENTGSKPYVRFSGILYLIMTFEYRSY